jgi:Trypsin
MGPLLVGAGCLAAGAEDDDVLGVVGSSRGFPPNEDVDSHAQSVIGGREDDAAFPAAGYLVREGIASCSAALIEPDLVLTAAHCVEGHHDIQFGWGVVGVNTPVRSIARAVHPRFVMPVKNGGVAFQGFDVALLRLAQPAGTEPAPLGSAPRLGRVHAIGYGATAYVPITDGGTRVALGVGTDRRSLEGTVMGQNPTEMFVRFAPGSSACYGDSGGPLFTDDGTLVAVLSRFTELGRCLPKDHSLMGYVRVDAMQDFLQQARECLPRVDEQEVAKCLREDARGLCAVPRFSNRGAPYPVLPKEGDFRKGTALFQLVLNEERSLTIVPEANVRLSLFSEGDARMRVLVDGREVPVVDNTTKEVLEAGKTYEVIVGSCNSQKQTFSLAWGPQRPSGETRSRSLHAMNYVRGALPLELARTFGIASPSQARAHANRPAFHGRRR